MIVYYQNNIDNKVQYVIVQVTLQSLLQLAVRLLLMIGNYAVVSPIHTQPACMMNWAILGFG